MSEESNKKLEYQERYRFWSDKRISHLSMTPKEVVERLMKGLPFAEQMRSEYNRDALGFVSRFTFHA